MYLQLSHQTPLLTQLEISCRPVAVQFGIQFVILAVYFESFGVEVDGAAESSPFVFIITFVLVHFCYC